MKKITVLIIMMVFMLISSSCVVVTPHDSGRHNGWYKNKGNPNTNNFKNQRKSNGKTSTVIILTDKH